MTNEPNDQPNLQAFVTEYFVAEPASRLAYNDLFVAYKQFCRETGFQPVHGVTGIREKLSEVFGIDIETRCRKIVDGRPLLAVKGVRLLRDINQILADLEAGQ